MISMTLGETLINLSEKPNDPKLDSLFKDLINYLEINYRFHNLGSTPVSNELYQHAIGSVLNAYASCQTVLKIKK